MDIPLVQTRNLVKQYRVGDEVIHAVNGVSIAVARGEFVAIMGASGSGKTTFMNVVGCLDVATSGAMLLDGTDTRTLSHDELAELRNRKVGFVFQQFNLLARTTALENAALPLVYANVSRTERLERARRKLDTMGLGSRLDHTPTKLSGGQQQRVAIARALITEPLMLLADEPTGALDSRTSEEIMGVFQRLNESGKTIVLVTHDSGVADHAARRVIFRDGRVLEDESVRSRRRARA